MKQMLAATFIFAACVATMPASAPTASDENWPQWRGPGGDGVVASAALPLTWSSTENVAWKTPVEGRGHSSPVVWGDRIFLTTAIEGEVIPGHSPAVHMRDGFYDENPGAREPYVNFDSTGGDRRHTLKGIAIDAGNGRVLWTRTLWDGPMHDNRHRAGSYASATAVTDGERVFFWFGSEGLYALDFDGETLWTFDPGDLPHWGLGHGTSPVLHDGRVILLGDHDNGEDSFLVALDAVTGEQAWRTPRLGRANWSTPLVAGLEGAEVLVVAGFHWTAAYDPRSGEELWRIPGLLGNVIATPLATDELAIVSVGYPDKRTYAVRLAARGQLGEDDKVWRHDKGTAYVASNLLLDGLVYLIDDRGTLTCLDADTGELVYEGGRVPMATRFTASPVGWSDGTGARILLSGQDGDMFVIQAGPEHRVLSVNSLGEELIASPAIAGDRLYVRGMQHLFAIGER